MEDCGTLRAPSAPNPAPTAFSVGKWLRSQSWMASSRSRSCAQTPVSRAPMRNAPVSARCVIRGFQNRAKRCSPISGRNACREIFGNDRTRAQRRKPSGERNRLRVRSIGLPQSIPAPNANRLGTVHFALHAEVTFGTPLNTCAAASRDRWRISMCRSRGSP